MDRPPFYLSRVHVEGFRSLRSVDFEPDRVTVLIGPNGAGKSNLLQFLHMIPMLRTGSLGRFVGEAGGASALLYQGPKVTRDISFSVDFQQESGTNRYSARLGYGAGDILLFMDEQVGFRPKGEDEFKVFSLGAGHRESRLDEAAREQGAKTARVVRECVARMNFYHFHDTSRNSALRTNSRAVDHKYLRSDGSNLAAYLLALRDSGESSDQIAWQRIRELLRRIAPFVKELVPTIVGSQRTTSEVRDGDADRTNAHVQLDWLDQHDALFGCHQLSDGTLRALALITALAQPTSKLPGMMCIDEPELGLHPVALTLVVELAKSISHRTQIILATQSLVLLDHFGPDEVTVAEYSDGATCLRRLNREGLAGWREGYTLSEIYDKNVIGGRP